MISNFRVFNTNTEKAININKNTRYSDVVEVAKAYATSSKSDVIVTIEIEDRHDCSKSLKIFVRPNGNVEPFNSACHSHRGYWHNNRYIVNTVSFFKYF